MYFWHFICHSVWRLIGHSFWHLSWFSILHIFLSFSDIPSGSLSDIGHATWKEGVAAFCQNLQTRTWQVGNNEIMVGPASRAPIVVCDFRPCVAVTKRRMIIHVFAVLCCFWIVPKSLKTSKICFLCALCHRILCKHLPKRTCDHMWPWSCGPKLVSLWKKQTNHLPSGFLT